MADIGRFNRLEGVVNAPVGAANTANARVGGATLPATM